MKNTCRVSQAINENEKPSNPRKAAKEDTLPELQNPGMPNDFFTWQQTGPRSENKCIKTKTIVYCFHVHDFFTWAFSFCKMPNLFVHVDKSPELQNPGMPNLFAHVAANKPPIGQTKTKNK